MSKMGRGMFGVKIGVWMMSEYGILESLQKLSRGGGSGLLGVMCCL